MTSKGVKTAMRNVLFRPYKVGKGPAFRLLMWDTGRKDERGQTYVRYEFYGCGSGKTISEGDTYSPAPSHAIDSDESVCGLIGFLTTEYDEESQTPDELAFAREHGDAVSMACIDMFGEDAWS